MANSGTFKARGIIHELLTFFFFWVHFTLLPHLHERKVLSLLSDFDVNHVILVSVPAQQDF